jgi:hypothetical protein
MRPTTMKRHFISFLDDENLNRVGVIVCQIKEQGGVSVLLKVKRRILFI